MRNATSAWVESRPNTNRLALFASLRAWSLRQSFKLACHPEEKRRLRPAEIRQGFLPALLSFLQKRITHIHWLSEAKPCSLVLGRRLGAGLDFGSQRSRSIAAGPELTKARLTAVQSSWITRN